MLCEQENEQRETNTILLGFFCFVSVIVIRSIVIILILIIIIIIILVWFGLIRLNVV